jgi:uncharacterized protein (TIGR00299 family) protein
MLAYFDCFAGISGDMTLGAFISLGVPVKWLGDEIRKIQLSDLELSAEPVFRNGITAQSVHVRTKDVAVSRDYSQIKSLIKKSSFSGRVKGLSLGIFEKIALAEAHIHGCPIDKIHFHEVGGIDAIVDIVGTALCVEYLGIEKIISSKIALGKGFLTCRHGTLPVPAPATLAILENIPVYGSGINHELVTPTGAAIITTLADAFEDMPNMTIGKIGYGAGKREFEERPNVLRVITGHLDPFEPDQPTGPHYETIGVVETCVDDMNPELLGFMMERLYEDGALEVYLLPIYMKKNRPGTMVQVLCRAEQKDVIIERILSETTSLGVRFYNTQRFTLFRESIMLDTLFGEIQVKRIRDLSGVVRVVPEYEVCRKIAIEKKVPLRIVYETIIKNFQAD